MTTRLIDTERNEVLMLNFFQYILLTFFLDVFERIVSAESRIHSLSKIQQITSAPN